MDPIRLATVWLGGCSGCHMSSWISTSGSSRWRVRSSWCTARSRTSRNTPRRWTSPSSKARSLTTSTCTSSRRIRRRTTQPGLLRRLAPSPATSQPCGTARHGGGRPRPRLPGGRGHRGAGPGRSGIVPVLLDRVQPLHEVVRVDTFLPGCPPPADRIGRSWEQVLAGKQPVLVGRDLKAG